MFPSLAIRTAVGRLGGDPCCPRAKLGCLCFLLPPTPPESPAPPSHEAAELALMRARLIGEYGDYIGQAGQRFEPSPIEVKLHDSDWVEP